MKRLSWLITLPVLIVVVVFAVNNRTAVVFDLWPAGLTVALPLYLTVLVAVVVGFIAGGGVVWFSSTPLRRTVRRQRHRLRDLEREVAKQKTGTDGTDYAIPPRRRRAANGAALPLPGG